MINLPLIYHGYFPDFSEKKVYIIIYEYANDLICIFKFKIKGQCLNFVTLC